MIGFKRRHDDGRVFPTGEGREYRRVDDYKPKDDWKRDESELDPNPKDTDPQDEEYQEQLKEEEQKQKEEEEEKKAKEQKLRKAESPSFAVKFGVKSDVKKLERADDSKLDKERSYQKYKVRVNRRMDSTHLKENEKVDRRREKALTKADKLEEKSEKLRKEIGE